jgi:hypothetical protein
MVEDPGHHVAAEAGSIAVALSLVETADFDLALLDGNIERGTSSDLAIVVEQRQFGHLVADLVRRKVFVIFASWPPTLRRSSFL